MKKTRRGFLGALALLPGAALFLGKPTSGSSTCLSDVLEPEHEYTPDYGGFKFKLGQRVRRRATGEEGKVLAVIFVGPHMAQRRWYQIHKKRIATYPFDKFPEDELEAVSGPYVLGDVTANDGPRIAGSKNRRVR